jgi:hypothetical protein
MPLLLTSRSASGFSGILIGYSLVDLRRESEILPMQRLIEWWRSWLSRLRSCGDDSGLPFEPEEVSRLILSGRPEDFKALAAGLSKQPAVRRNNDDVNTK